MKNLPIYDQDSKLVPKVSIKLQIVAMQIEF